MKAHLSLPLAAGLLVAASSVHAVQVFSPGDFILGGQSDGISFNVGIEGTQDGANNWPGGESPGNVIDGDGDKYLNFAELNTGFLVTPSLGGSLNTIVSSITVYTANDAPERDPTSYQLFGTNTPISGSGPFALTNFVLISAGPLTLPSARQDGDGAPLDQSGGVPANTHETVTFVNTADYDSYLVIFPTVANAPAANSMQLGEVRLEGTVVPEPSALTLLGLATAGAMALRRRR